MYCWNHPVRLPDLFCRVRWEVLCKPTSETTCQWFWDAPAKIFRTSSSHAVHGTGNNNNSQEPKPGADKPEKLDTHPAGEVLPGSCKDKPAGLLPGANPPTRRSKRPERDVEPPSKQKYDKYYHRQGCAGSPFTIKIKRLTSTRSHK